MNPVSFTPPVRKEIVLVDDNPTILSMCRNILKPFHKVYAITSSGELFAVLGKTLPDLILLDIEMPGENGYDVIKKLKADPRFSDIPVIFLTAKSDEDTEIKGFDLGAVDYIFKPFSPPLLLRRVETHLLIAEQRKILQANAVSLKHHATDLESKLNKVANEAAVLKKALFNTIGDMVEFRDAFTGGHNSRCLRYMNCLMDKVIKNRNFKNEITDWDLDFFMASVPLHDVGKIAIPDRILMKTHALSQEEFEIIKSHVVIGMDAIEKIMSTVGEHVFLRHALHLIGSHHEKWDGTGYPMRLSGRNIPLEGRMMAIVDVYDALISERPYKEALSYEAAGNIIKNSAGTHFDPILVDVFCEVEAEFIKIARHNHGSKIVQ